MNGDERITLQISYNSAVPPLKYLDLRVGNTPVESIKALQIVSVKYLSDTLGPDSWVILVWSTPPIETKPVNYEKIKKCNYWERKLTPRWHKGPAASKDGSNGCNVFMCKIKMFVKDCILMPVSLVGKNVSLVGENISLYGW